MRFRTRRLAPTRTKGCCARVVGWGMMCASQRPSMRTIGSSADPTSRRTHAPHRCPRPCRHGRAVPGLAGCGRRSAAASRGALGTCRADHHARGDPAGTDRRADAGSRAAAHRRPRADRRARSGHGPTRHDGTRRDGTRHDRTRCRDPDSQIEAPARCRRRQRPADRDRSIHRRPHRDRRYHEGRDAPSPGRGHQGRPLVQARVPRVHGQARRGPAARLARRPERQGRRPGRGHRGHRPDHPDGCIASRHEDITPRADQRGRRAGECGRRDRRYGYRGASGPQRRRWLQLLERRSGALDR